MEYAPPACFKAYDIRGKVPDELNPEMARDIGRAFQVIFNVKKVVVVRDIRLSGKEICDGLISGLLEMGVDVIDMGVGGTEEMYHASFSLESKGVDGGIMVTASHNPVDYNGMKLVVKGAQPVSGDSGLDDMAEIIVHKKISAPSGEPGVLSLLEDKSSYISHLLNYVKGEELKPLKIVVNSGNGCSGAIIDLLQEHLPFEFVKIHHDPDGTFPNGVPNPLLPENREETGRVVCETGADFGVAWDGDFDRCFFWDENGRFIEGYYIVGLLAMELLAKEPGSKILHDPRLIWNTEELVKEAGGIPIMTKTGHAFIKERMRKENALYGGEMSAHHYFRDFGYCDSGMIPWLLIASLLGRKSTSLSELVTSRISAYPVSGEINSVVTNPDKVIADIKEYYLAGEIDWTDGLSISFDTYRFNVRKSNTEPLLRLNVESRGNNKVLEEKTRELRNIVGRYAKK